MSKSPPELTLHSMHTVAREPLRWLWEGRVPLGKVSLLTGDPGLGKSFVTLDLAARVSRGEGVPPERGLEGPASVVLLSADDDPADTLQPRLVAAEADLERIQFIKPAPRRQKAAPSIDAGLGRIARAVRTVEDLRLIVVDPVAAWLRNVDTNSNRDVHSVIGNLNRFARRIGAAVLLVSHHRKLQAANSLHRTVGSLAFTSAVRTVFAVRQDPAVADRRLLLPLKATLVAEPTGRAFTIEDGRLQWDAEPFVAPPTSADQFVIAEASVGDHIKEVAGWLLELVKEGPRPSTEIRQLARERRIAHHVLWKAKAQAGIEAKRDGEQARWFWHAPARKKTPFELATGLEPLVPGDDLLESLVNPNL